jgi:hypothetical protein
MLGQKPCQRIRPLGRTAEKNAGQRWNMPHKGVAAILAHVANSNQTADHRQRSHHHRYGEPEDLDPRLEGEVAELVGREAGDYLYEEDEEGPEGGLGGRQGGPPVGEEGGIGGVLVGGEGGGVGAGGGRVVLPSCAVHQFPGLAAGLLYSGGFNCFFSVEIALLSYPAFSSLSHLFPSSSFPLSPTCVPSSSPLSFFHKLSLPIPTSFAQVPSHYPTFLPSSNLLSFLHKLSLPIPTSFAQVPSHYTDFPPLIQSPFIPSQTYYSHCLL